MKLNVGKPDKWVRIVLALVLITLNVFKVIEPSSILGIISLVFSGILLATAFLNFCPIWYTLGISTHKKGQTKNN